MSVVSALPDASHRIRPAASQHSPFLAIPPFPGRRIWEFTHLPQTAAAPVSLTDCLALLREHRVGGTYWESQPQLPPAYLLVRSQGASAAYASLVEQYGEAVVWLEGTVASSPGALTVIGACDPWHMLSGARALLCDADDEVRLIAAILGIPTYLTDTEDGASLQVDGVAEKLLQDALPVDAVFASPFTGEAVNFADLIDLSGFWRLMIDANRSIGGGVGFAFWKQDSVLPLLWGGGDCSNFFRYRAEADGVGAVALWRSKAAPHVVEQIDRNGTPVFEVEDGFLRSSGLGADCVPPLSITVDRMGPYFDPAQPSELEDLLQNGQFKPALLDRARRLRQTVVAAGLGKYDRGGAVIDRLDQSKTHILVPGQVEDDRSVLTGGAGLVSNLELLKRVRARHPDAFVIYKPHPDVIAGHRAGHIPDNVCLQFADRIMADAPISSLISMVDEVHVNTSLTGFEALMRLKKVTTYGIPFYAGWGLTCDLGPVPARRTRKRSLDEMVAATLLVYPRYLDPVTGLPCPAEVVVDRLTSPGMKQGGPLTRLRRLQGRLKRRFAGWRTT